MKKQKINYVLRRSPVFGNKTITAKRELSFGLQLASRLILDELSYEFNKHKLDEQINEAIANEDRDSFDRLSKQYQPYTWE
ncbi:IDEAL domain-containing protein [Thalassobacillus cyri]|uniref:IDEAL domain-containing protein n=1 Tax=Thalassobacillus cyri TaxID=571932 RepID=A0A1H4GHE9_9BACI|nr:IDEAL domain-containing protein [Thalassobacillus cyri]SEB08994.1 IDEAL domain-containing protein [Thalassobacillus cyri]